MSPTSYRAAPPRGDPRTLPPPRRRVKRRLLAPQARIEEIAQGVAHDVEGEHGQHDRQPGEGRDPRAALDVLPALAEDVAPARRGRGDAEAEERQTRLRADGGGDVERGHD